ncbi:hypothetical protein [Ferrovibrio sp.]|uniref:hypothetical protein n=1 Tax=Ferrovibrio sp. TaxID=1917215 RepID=UPI00311F18F3
MKYWGYAKSLSQGVKRLMYRTIFSTQKWHLRNQSKLRQMLCHLVDLRLRLLEGYEQKYGENKSIDKTFSLAARVLLTPSWFVDDLEKTNPRAYEIVMDLRMSYAENKVKIDELISKHRSDELIKESCRLAYSIGLSISQFASDVGDRELYQKCFSEIDRDPVYMDFANLAKFQKWTRDRRAELEAELREKFIVKLPFAVDEILKWSGLFYSSMFVAAYFRAWLLYGNFGISVSDYFGISDYLAASLETLGAAALASTFAMLMMFSGLQHATGRLYVRNVEGAFDRRRLTDLLIYVGSAALPISILALDDEALFYSVLQLPLVVVSFLIASKISKEMFRDVSLAIFSISFLLLLGANVYCSTMREVVHLKKSTEEPCESYTIADGLVENPCNLRIIGMTERNAFFYDAATKKTLVLPTESIRRATAIPTDRWNVFPLLRSLYNYLFSRAPEV